jgi:LuxR family transcriptional regulator, maltose regulon positive regulatory protein
MARSSTDVRRSIGDATSGDPASPVVATKLRMPSLRPEAIARDRVIGLLAAGDDRPLTVVCAPAGYGKTTALVEWLAAKSHRWAWVSIDELDNDPRRLCAHVLAAIDVALPGAMQDAQRALAGGSDVHETVLGLALNALADAADAGLVVVLDDYHCVEHPSCHKLVMGLIDGLPADARVVVSSRTPPPLRLARRRATGALAEIGVEELSFHPEESERLLNGSLGLDLDPDQIAAIDERTRGWAAGLSLVASSLPRRPERDEFLDAFARSGTRVSEYLIEEVLDACRPPLRDFLRRTSILGRLCASLCEAVLDDPGAGELLAEVQRTNLFITGLENDGRWLRYHDLFAAMLQRELEASEPGLIPELHLRASRWYEQARHVEEAIEHASAAGDGRRAAALMYEHGTILVRDRRYVSVCRLIDAMPPDRGEYGPYCRALRLLARGLDGGSPTVIYEEMQELKAHYDAPGVEQLVEHSLLSPFFGRVGEAVQRGRALLERSREEPLAIRAEIASNLGLLLWFTGESGDARALLEQHLDAMAARRRSPAFAALAFIAVEQGQPATAIARGEAAVAEAERMGGESGLEFALAYQALADALRAAGRHDDAERVVTHAGQVTSKVPGALNHALTLVLQAELELARGERSEARRAASEARVIIDRYPDVGVLANRLAAVEATLERRASDTMLGSRPTPAEMRLLALLDSDLTLKQIAADHLYVSINTVTSHAQRLYRRLGVRTRTEAVAAARERGLL